MEKVTVAIKVTTFFIFVLFEFLFQLFNVITKNSRLTYLPSVVAQRAFFSVKERSFYTDRKDQ